MGSSELLSIEDKKSSKDKQKHPALLIQCIFRDKGTLHHGLVDTGWSLKQRRCTRPRYRVGLPLLRGNGLKLKAWLAVVGWMVGIA